MSDDIGDFELPEPPVPDLDGGGALGQADIDALFGDVAAAPPPRSGVRALLECDTAGHERLPMLEVICDRVIRTFATNMRHLTSDAIEVGLDDVGNGRFGELMNRAALPAMFGVFRIAEWDSYGVIVVEPALIYSVVDALLGGRRGGGQVRVEGRAFTSIETSLVSRMMQLALSDFAAAFEPVAPISIVLERIETSPRFAAIAGPSIATAVCTFGVAMEERGGRFTILLPHTALEPVRAELGQRFMGEKMGHDPAWEAHLDREVRRTQLQLSAVLAERVMTLGAVGEWRVGQTLNLQRPADGPLQLRHAGVPLAEAHLGRRGACAAVRLLNDFGEFRA